MLGVVCAGWLVAGCGSTGGNHSTGTSGPSALTTVTQQQAATSMTTVPSVSSTTRATRPGPLTALNEYWQSINAHKFEAAYAKLVPGSVTQSEPQFVSEEQQAGIQTATFRGRVTSVAGSTATVDVTSLVTDDAQFGCHSWMGSYQLSNESSRWLIARASITPGPCASGQSAPTPSQPSNQPGTAPTASTPSSPGVETPGSLSHATDDQFCSTHQCIQNFPNGNGYIVQCVDGEWSHSGGLSGACSDHGGES